MRTAIVVMLLSLSHAICLFGQISRTASTTRASDITPLVTLSSSDEIVDRGDRMRVWFGTAQNAYVIVFRVDTDGRVRMLYPERPWHDAYVRAGRMLEVKNHACDQASCAFIIDDYPGQGYVFAIASISPFEFDRIANGDYWDYTEIAHGGRVLGDPFVSLSMLMNRILPEPAEGGASYDVSEYHVGAMYDYPRFLCYECHSFVRFPSWNPYARECSRYQIVRYDDAAYQSAIGYLPTRTVFSRPREISPRFVFTDRVQGAPFITDGRGRGDGGSFERVPSAGASARDIGGFGSVPAPLGRPYLPRVKPLLRRLGTRLS